MDFNERIESLFEEYQRQRNSLTEMQQKMRALTATATSPRREVTVTVGQNGVLTDIKFPTSAHKRLTPADLTEVILAAYGEAKEDVTGQAAAVLAPMLPEGTDARALVDGSAGTDAYLPAEPRMATSVREMLGLGRTPR
ncbi:YbaB/EbfC family nucleoid-associated protein [Actinoplanes bogorensis]|uniref:YbaB/EbfC family nucleoid-associated protein n=1 Tax=Paractinoplanes bogorensis TaxID=1610840 RepID=A0ABS5Z3P3_9ACTN|nr:YbaB/EbfC family nucleoid-associated protein [Actinoplanes bogorensis]MBU2670262.1 YbaB/EbfC family nucleoid-associated protein [Actinoplanes bogorensis]